MKNLSLIINNIFIPFVTGLLFLVFFLYFIFTKHPKKTGYKYFILFLLSFSIYLIGRPLQVLLGLYPIPLIINNLRLLILCGISMPMLILTADIFKKNILKFRKLIIIGFGVFLGILYAVFNTLGTKGSEPLFKIIGNVNYYHFISLKNSPFFNKNVTSGIQLLIGFIIAAVSILKIIQLKINLKLKCFLKNHNFIINLGIAIFGISFLISSILKKWSTSYFFSIVSAIIIGIGILIEIKKIYLQVDKFIPFIKDDIIKNISFISFSKENIIEMLNALGKKTNLDTFAVLKFTGENIKGKKLTLYENISDLIRNLLEEEINDENFIIFPFSSNIIGISLSVTKNLKSNNLLIFFENIKDEIIKKTGFNIKIGIGKTYTDLDNLNLSYYEALRTLEYAENFEDSCIVHIDNINENYIEHINYPHKEKEELLLSIRLGDINNTIKNFKLFFNKFKEFIKGKPEMLKIRLYEFIISIIDSAIFGGGDEKKLHELDSSYFNNINNLKNLDQTKKWLNKTVIEISTIVSSSNYSRKVLVINKAKKIIEEKYNDLITIDDIAKEICISRSYFFRIFKEINGTTFNDYLTNIRIIHAKEMLLKTDKNITDIAYEIGFNDSNYFSKVFTEIEGQPPTKYRKQNQALLEI